MQAATLDIRTAFLDAPLYQDKSGRPVLTPEDFGSGTLDFDLLVRKLQSVHGKKVKIVVVQPPKILNQLGLIEEGEKWLVIKALYGLAEAPRRWSSHRDLRLGQISWVENGRTFSLVQSQADANIWKVVSRPTAQGERDQEPIDQQMHGLLGVYVDDMLITAEDPVIQAVIRELRNTWATSDPEFAAEDKPIRFCGFNLHKLREGGFLLNQQDFIQDLLQKFPSVSGVAEVPCLKEEELSPEDPNPSQLKEAQTITGALQWLTTRSRPDLVFAVNKTAQLMARFPEYATKYAHNILRYLRGTQMLGLKFQPLSGSSDYGQGGELAAPRTAGLIEVYGDASFAPGNGKSQTGLVATLSGHVIAWASHRQSVTSQSSAESELYATSDGVLLLQILEPIIPELHANPVRKLVYNDNVGCVSLYSAPSGSWRTRHLRLKARGGRELLESGFFELRHLVGKWMLADLATKALASPRHRELLQLLNMGVPSRDAGGEDPVLCKLDSSSKVPKAKGSHSAMDSLRLLVFGALLVHATDKWIITIEKTGEESMTPWRILTAAVLLVLLSLVMLRRWNCETGKPNDPPEQVRALRVPDDDEWSVVQPADEREAEQTEGRGFPQGMGSTGPVGAKGDGLGCEVPQGSGFGDPVVPHKDDIGSGLRNRRGATVGGASGLRESRAQPAVDFAMRSTGAEKVGIRNEGEIVDSGLGEALGSDDQMTVSGLGKRSGSPQQINRAGMGESASSAAQYNSGMRDGITLAQEDQGERTTSSIGDDQRGSDPLSDPIRAEEVRIHPSWKLRVPPRAFWPTPHPWAGVQGNWHQPIPVGASRDTFHSDKNRQVLVRFHPKVRIHRFDPSKCVLPLEVPLFKLTGSRRTYIKHIDGRLEIEEDNFMEIGSTKIEGNWTGRTEFQVQPHHQGPNA